MSGVMMGAVIRMPIDMALNGAVAQMQYHARANNLLDKYEDLIVEREKLIAALLAAEQSLKTIDRLAGTDEIMTITEVKVFARCRAGFARAALADCKELP